MRLRIISYNIHKGIGGIDRRYDPDRIVASVAPYEADVLMFQEVDDGVPRSRRERQVDLLGDALGYAHRAFQQNVSLTEGFYGNAILSRWPLTDIRDLDLTLPFKKRRQALAAHVHLSDGEHTRTLKVYNMHLGLAGYERSIQARRILSDHDLSHSHHDTPVIVAGDTNDWANSLGPRWLEPAGFQQVSKTTRTFPAFSPVRALDRMYFRGDLVLDHCFAAHTKIARQASDHLPLVAEFEVKIPAD